MTDLVVLLTAHFIGDFVLQSDRVATGKSKCWRTLLEHVSFYMLPFLPAVGFLVGFGPNGWVTTFFALTFALHFLTDAVTSRITSKLWFLNITPTGETGKIWRGGGNGGVRIEPLCAVEDTGTRHWFFVMIGFDQLLHVYALAWAWSFVR